MTGKSFLCSAGNNTRCKSMADVVLLRLLMQYFLSVSSTFPSGHVHCADSCLSMIQNSQ